MVITPLDDRSNNFPYNLGPIFHQGHSSIAIDEYGLCVEIRRGFKRFERIGSPCVWTTFQQWSESITATGRDWFIDRPIREDWNTDQQLVADFTEGSNLRIQPVSHERVDRIQFMVSRAQMDYHCYPTIPENYSRVLFWGGKYNELNRDIQCGGEYIPSGRARILVSDQTTDMLKPVYIHLETGILATSNNRIGRSFQELGLVPQRIYANAFGENYQIL